jgi:signal transduction histidine kinase
VLDNGRFAAGGYGYLVSFDPLAIRPNPSAPKTTITSFAVFSEPQDTLLGQQNVRLRASQNVLSFSFSALNFTNPEMSQFRYQLVGADPQVIEAGTRNFASYANLRPGEYTFMVWSSNNHGIWNETPATFAFTIVPPFWQRPLFIYLCALVVLLLAVLFYKLRIRQIHRRQQLKLSIALEAQEKERARLATDLHDDLGTKMSTLKLFLNSMEPYLDDAQAVKINTHAQHMLDQSISGLRNVLSDLSPRLLQKAGLIAAIAEIATQVNQGQKLTVEFRAPKHEQRFTQTIEVALFRVVQELIHNAIKHAKCSLVTIELRYTPQSIELRFSDNGIGFSAAQQALGYGIRNIKQRLELINGEALWQATENGTKVEITIPYKPALHDSAPSDSSAVGR